MSRRFARFALAALVALAVLPAVRAGKVYRWVDAKGVVHYGDHVPQDAATAPARVDVVPVSAEPTAIATLRTQASGHGFQAIAENRLAGPIEVRMDFSRARNVRGNPDLPVRAVVPALRGAVVSYIDSVDLSQPGDFELRMDVVPGDPRARPQDVEYVLPLQMAGWRIDQGFGGSFSHDDEQNRFALDLAAPIGTPVLAARD
ncbi:MAG TPA: DUF4124 domain-containing protein, partial [Lysobacter sp.]